jgi:VanZ family protein
LSAWIPVALCVCVIALESTEMFGAQNTTGPLRTLYQTIFGNVTDQRWDVLHHYIRKTGHFLGYGTIGLCWLRAWHMTMPCLSLLFDAALALLGTALIASSDEFHQSFLPDRTGMFSDVLLDCCGALVMLSLLVAALVLSRKLHSRGNA